MVATLVSMFGLYRGHFPPRIKRSVQRSFHEEFPSQLQVARLVRMSERVSLLISRVNKSSLGAIPRPDPQQGVAS